MEIIVTKKALRNSKVFTEKLNIIDVIRRSGILWEGETYEILKVELNYPDENESMILNIDK